MNSIVLIGLEPDFAEAIRSASLASDLEAREEIDPMAALRLFQSEHDRIDTVVLGTNSSEPIQLAQRLQTIDANVSVLILSPDEQLPKLRKAVQFAPFISEQVRCVAKNPAQVMDALLYGVRSTRQRRNYAKLVNSAQRTLATLNPPPLQALDISYFSQLHDFAPIGIAVVGPRGQILAWNKKAREITGQVERDVLGTDFAALFYLTELENIRAAVTTTLRSGGATQLVTERSGPNGAPQFIEMSLSPLSGRNREAGILLMFQDVTERKRTEEELYRSKLAAESANRAKTSFLANMSHEIRTPLGAVLGFSDLLANSEGSAIDRQLWSESIRRNGTQLMKIIDEILDLSKIEAGALDLELVRVNIPMLLDEVMSMLSIRAEEKALKLHVRNIGPLPLEIVTDPTRLKQILVNIIGNAIKFSSHGTIEFLAFHEQDQLIFDICDTGPGLSPEQGTAIFQPFVQADSSVTRRFGGTGLGLALSRRLAQALGGEVKLHSSAIGAGSIFRIALPAPSKQITRFVDRLQTGASRESDTAPAQAEHSLNGLRVLLVEDSIDNQVLVGRILKAKGAMVTVANNGQEGIDLARSADFDIVLMDLQMPVLDGYGAVTRLREANYAKPIVALTAHAMKEERDHCLKLGFNDHLTKPINRTQLISTILRLTLR